MTRPQKRVWWSVLTASGLALVAALWIRLPESSSVVEAKQIEEEVRAVRTQPAERGSLTLRARHAGELDADVTEISAQTSGLLQAVRVRIGDGVERGQILAQVDASEAQQQILEARAQVRIAASSRQRVGAELEAARTELERTEPLSDDQLVSAQELDTLRARVRGLEAELQTAGAQREQAEARIAVLKDQVARARLRAPFDGAVAERHLDPGAVVQQGTRVLRLVRSGPLRVRFRVPEREVGRVSVGMPLEVTTQATGEETFAGEVTRLSAEIARTDRSLAVEGVLKSVHEGLRPGAYAQVRLTYDTLEGAVHVPAEAIVEQVDTAGQPKVGAYVVREGRAHWQGLSVRGRSLGRVAVEGLEPGAQVVTMGQQDLREGAAVRVAQDG